MADQDLGVSHGTSAALGGQAMRVEDSQRHRNCVILIIVNDNARS
ncbi:hypothetical protein ACFQE5_21325 [Pseudonocardia hispaniensis]|uniref:Uncharacterized protein n=1 Tax=Pseudonocardia hispaniensis TaxID=904933 RepID=A0ABW1J7U3_9PSEU